MDRLDALATADDLRAAYPGRAVTDRQVQAWAAEFENMLEREAKRCLELISARSADPPSRAQILQVLREVRQVLMSAKFDPDLCVFVDGVMCHNCDPAGVIHGHLLDPAQMFHGAFHLSRGEMAQAQHPEECDCGLVLPADVDPAKVVGLVIESLPFKAPVG